MSRKLSFLYILLFGVFVTGFTAVYLSTQKPFCANSISCKESFNLKVENEVSGVFDGQVVVPPKINLAEKKSPIKVLGEATVSGEKHIYVDLTNQTLTAYQGDTLFMQTQISSGKWHPTPIGDFKIWEKVRATRMTGGTGADFYDLPNVPYVMFFGGGNVPDGAGFGLHGTYWHDNFGHPMSHGCVNMRTVDAEKLYGWAEVGTPVTINGQAP